MKARRKILAPKLRQYFHLEESNFSFNNNFYFNTQIFNGFTFLTSFSCLCLFLGLIHSIFWAVGGGTVCLLVYLYMKTHRLCDGITILRETPKIVREKTEMTIIYRVSNETAFSLPGLSFVEDFDGVQDAHFSVNSPKTIPAHTQVLIKHKIFLNAGMGNKTFKPIRLSIRDELGIYDFKLEFPQIHTIEVYPYLEETPKLKTSVSPDSIEYGPYELSKRGDTNLFMGTREYRRGDPVKHINWKLTKKSDKIVVNEYEKSTNAFVTLLLELNLKTQSGSGEISTWEVTKDLALSICHNELKKSNAIQVVSNNLYIPFSSGKNQISMLEKLLTLHEMKNSDDVNYTRHLSFLPSRSQIYYVCPVFFSPESLEVLEQLKRLTLEGHKIIVFAINPLEEMAKDIQGKNKKVFLEMNRNLTDNLQRIKTELKNMGIPLIPISPSSDKSLNDQIIESARDLLEVS